MSMTLSLAPLASPRWQCAFKTGARPQRLLMASRRTKDPKASDVLYIKVLAAPLTINTRSSRVGESAWSQLFYSRKNSF